MQTGVPLRQPFTVLLTIREQIACDLVQNVLIPLDLAEWFSDSNPPVDDIPPSLTIDDLKVMVNVGGANVHQGEEAAPADEQHFLADQAHSQEYTYLWKLLDKC